MKRKISVGDIFGHLSVVGFTKEKRGDGRTRGRVVVKCDCGTEKSILAQSLYTGETLSCGCHMKDRADPKVLFHQKVNIVEGGCHLWTAGLDSDGYGKFALTTTTRRQKHIKATHFAFFLRHGRWPTAFVLHSCDTPACVNPDHLSEGTQRENITQCVQRGRHHATKTDPEMVRVWRQRFETGVRVASIAREFGVPYGRVSQAVHGRTWRHL